ncbi:hypothetical protein AB205_0083320 [Aquarana catesbeiana]|uniref:Uncharacterized protein n=1 Tax=Aquarana catesbeiana TaxID=8400 RepID=A0A2G9SK57_AQUCT|nr:hypothetical protein AB205_0083320 [Aquarana catesbeiana]
MVTLNNPNVFFAIFIASVEAYLLNHEGLGKRKMHYTLNTFILLFTAGQKKQLEDHSDLAQEECKSETAENSIEEHVEGGHDADGEEMTDGIEEDFDEDGSNELMENHVSDIEDTSN